MVNKAWVSEAMDLYARAMLMFERRDRNMAWAKKDKAYAWMTTAASRTSVDRHRLLNTIKLARMCHKQGMRLMLEAKGLANETCMCMWEGK